MNNHFKPVVFIELLASVAGLLMAASAHATAPVGATPGSHQVTPSGAFTYTIPIAIPPGVAGIEPKLSLAYNSQGGNGLLGMGWSLSGLSVIHRCPRTVAQDGALGGVNYDANDRYCLDGQRLVAINGAYGADGTEYRTESESYSRIVGYGNQAGSPAWWKVWTKSGQILEYGNTADSRIEAQGKTAVMLWALNRLADTVGNYLTVSYIEDNPNGQYYPDRIDYTGNTTANKAPVNSVRFVYEARPDVTPAYQAGSLSKLTVRLANVQGYAGDSLGREYRIAYEQSAATQRTRLAALTECTAADACLEPTVLAWSGSPEMSFGQIVESPFVAGDTSTTSNDFNVGDFNGDGFADLVKAAGTTHVALGSATGELVGTMLGPSSSYLGLIAGDLNGDGLSDVLRWQSLCFSAFTTTSLGGLISPGNSGIFLRSDACGAFPPYGILHSGLYLHDINGDGRRDVIWYTVGGGGRGPLRDDISVVLAADAGRFTYYSWSGRVQKVRQIDTNVCLSSVIGVCKQTQWFDIAELNGDGKADAIRYLPNSGYLYAWFSVGDGSFNGNVASYFVAGGTTSDRRFMMADANGDGLGDAVLFVPSTGALSVALALGDGRFGAVTQASFIAGGTPADHWFLMVDMNGDGKADAVKFDPATGNLSVALGHGDGNFNSPLTIPFLAGGTPANRWFRMADINGDGYPDAVLHVPGSNKVQVLPSSRQVLDVMNTLTNGLGVTTTVTYKPLTDASVYAKDSTAVYPYVDIQAPMYVAASVAVSDGRGGEAVTHYTYAGAKSHQQGGGFLGFRQVTVHDPQAKLRSVTTYRQDYPYQGQPLGTQKVTESGVLISQNLITYTDQILDPAKSPTWRQSLPGRTVESSFELDGSPISTVNTDTQYDAWGNPTRIVVDSGGGYSKITTNTYDNIVDDTRWFLGRLRQSTVTSVTP